MVRRMFRFRWLGTLAAVCAIAVAAPVSDAAPKKPKPGGATIALVAPGLFTVSYRPKLENDAYSVWVANVCRDGAGVVVSAGYLPVQWAGGGGFPTSGQAGTFVAGAGAVSCSAYAWRWWDAWSPISNTIEYAVAG